MKANCWVSPNKVEVTEVPDPTILNSRDAIVKITSTAICGSDLHLLDGYVPTMQKGDIMGHEFMGEVVEVGPGVDRDKLRVGDRVVVPFPIGCGACFACQHELWSCCENTNPNAGMAEKMFGHPVAGIYGYSHLTGGFAGGQAEYARVVLADVNPLKIESDLSDEQVLFLSDILPTGYMGAEMCEIADGDVVAVWGAGPVGQFAMDSARVLGAAKVIAIDDVPYRLEMAASQGYETINYSRHRRPLGAARARPAAAARTSASTPSAWRPPTAPPTSTSTTGRSRPSGRRPTGRTRCARRSLSCRSGGIVSVIGVYGGFIDKFPAGSWMNRALTLQDRAVPRPALHAPAARAHRARRDRPHPGHHPPAAAGRGAARLRHLQAQAGSLREGRPQGLAVEREALEVLLFRSRTAAGARAVNDDGGGVVDVPCGDYALCAGCVRRCGSCPCCVWPQQFCCRSACSRSIADIRGWCPRRSPATRAPSARF